MEFVLAGFKQFDNIRQYHFDTVGEDRSRQQVTVDADLSLIRRYGIGAPWPALSQPGLFPVSLPRSVANSVQRLHRLRAER